MESAFSRVYGRLILSKHFQKAKTKEIDDYKKEFADATGIDISGKVDKSAALCRLVLLSCKTELVKVLM